MSAQLFFVVNTFALALASVWVAQWAVGGREAWRVMLTAGVNFGLGAFWICMAAGFAGYLTVSGLTWATAAVTVIAAYLRFRTRRVRTDYWGRFLGAAKQELPLTLTAFGLLGVPLALLWHDASFEPTVLHWDDYSYHAATVAHWLSMGRIELPAFAYQVYYPFNAEAFASWFIVPFGDDAYASLAGFYWTLLGVLAVASLVYAMGRPLVDALLLAAAFVTCFWVAFTGRTFSAPDLAGPVLVLASAAFWLGRDSAGPRERAIDALYAGVLAGFAVGSKVTFAPAGLLLFGMWAIRSLLGSRGIDRFRLPAVFVIGSLTTGFFWYARNWLLTGNPVFPAEVGPFAGPFDAASLAETTLFSVLVERKLELWEMRRMLIDAINWPVASMLIAAAGYVVAALHIRKRFALRTEGDELDLWLVAIGIIGLLYYPFLPFSGAIDQPEPYMRHHFQPRLLILAYCCGILLFRRALESPRLRLIARVAVLAAVLLAFPQLSQVPAWAYVASGLAVTLAMAAVLRAGSSKALVVAWTVFGAWLFVLSEYHATKHLVTTNAVFEYGTADKPLGQAWKRLESLEPGTRLAFFMAEPENYTLYYPIFGRRLQLRPVPLDGEGRPREPLHLSWRRKEGRWWDDWFDRVQVTPGEFLENARRSGVDYVLVTRWDIGEWPQQYQLLNMSEEAELEYSDGFSALWRIGATP